MLTPMRAAARAEPRPTAPNPLALPRRNAPSAESMPRFYVVPQRAQSNPPSGLKQTGKIRTASEAPELSPPLRAPDPDWPICQVRVPNLQSFFGFSKTPLEIPLSTVAESALLADHLVGRADDRILGSPLRNGGVHESPLERSFRPPALG